MSISGNTEARIAEVREQEHEQKTAISAKITTNYHSNKQNTATGQAIPSKVS